MHYTIQEFVKGLRAMADWYEANGDNEILDLSPLEIRGNLWAWDKEKFASKAKSFGKSEKVSDDSYFMLRKNFSTSIILDLNIHHTEMCERIKVGEKVIPAHVVPATEETHVPERTEEVFEWRCPKSVFSLDAELESK